MLKTTFSRTLVLGTALALLGCGGMSDARRATVEASPNYQDGRFKNGLARAPIPFFSTLGAFISGHAQTTPKEPPPVLKRKGNEFDEVPASGLRITWLGHSSSLIEIDGYRVLLDPVFGERVSPFTSIGPKRFHEPPLPLAELPDLDAVVISHDHYDHLDKFTILQLLQMKSKEGGAKVKIFAVPLGVGQHLEDWGVPLEQIQERDWWGEISIKDLSLTATPARHTSGRSVVMSDHDHTLWASWAIRGPEHSVYFSGDTAFTPQFAEIGERLGPFDAALMETGAYNPRWRDIHMGPEQAVKAHRLVKGGLYLPVHWGTFDLALHGWTEPAERVLQAASHSGVPFAIPRPGQSIEPSQPPAFERWWPMVPWSSAIDTPVQSSGLEE